LISTGSMSMQTQPETRCVAARHRAEDTIERA
jgi:hypothetical protein